MRTPFKYLRNDWTDCAGIWCTYHKVRGGVHMHVRSYSYLYLGNSGVHCAAIYPIVIDQLATSFTRVASGVNLQVCTYVPLFHILGKTLEALC